MAIGNKHRRALLSAVLLLAALTLTAQAGPLEPPVPPGTPTMHPIDQVEPRIPIYAGNLPLTINEPGSYYLAEDIETTGPGIEISTSFVTLDLMGFSLRGGAGPAIFASTSVNSVIVRNGEIYNWTGAGVILDHACSVSDLIVRANDGSGIVMGLDARVERCTSDHNGGHGIIVQGGSSIVDSVSNDNDENGIWVELPAGYGSGLVSGCVTDGNEKNGIRVDGYTIVRNNVSNGNDNHSSGKAGIWVNGDGNRIEGNHLVDNNIGLDISGSYNFIGGNTMWDNITQNWQLSGTATGNLFRIWTVASPGEPGHWDNIDLGSAP
jgi:hypothetical protein